jgi:hypothetical protein
LSTFSEVFLCYIDIWFLTHEIIVTPLREYIEKKLKKALVRITKLENQEIVAAVMLPQPQQLNLSCP